MLDLITKLIQGIEISDALLKKINAFLFYVQIVSAIIAVMGGVFLFFEMERASLTAIIIGVVGTSVPMLFDRYLFYLTYCEDD